MKYTESQFGEKFGVSLGTKEEQELFLKANATCTYHLSLIIDYITHFESDHAHVRLNRLRKAGLCH